MNSSTVHTEAIEYAKNIFDLINPNATALGKKTLLNFLEAQDSVLAKEISNILLNSTKTNIGRVQFKFMVTTALVNLTEATSTIVEEETTMNNLFSYVQQLIKKNRFFVTMQGIILYGKKGTRYYKISIKNPMSFRTWLIGQTDNQKVIRKIANNLTTSW